MNQVSRSNFDIDGTILFVSDKPMKRHFIFFLLFFCLALLAACTFLEGALLKTRGLGPSDEKRDIIDVAHNILAKYDRDSSYPGLSITYPYHESVFPPEIAAPTFVWEDTNPLSKSWLAVVRFSSKKKPAVAIVGQKRWTPAKDVWEIIKSNSVHAPAEVAILGIAQQAEYQITSADRISFTTSKHNVESAIFYRQVPLPFILSKKSFERTRWRLGHISSYNKPAVVMENIPVCASCHMFSKDGRFMSMEMNYKNDSGAHFIAPIETHIRLNKDHFFTWSDVPRKGALPPTRGLFGKMSPSGRYVISTVNEISYAAITNDLIFSQLFFPTFGILAIYDVANKKFFMLPGADDYRFVHANPNWSPDEKNIVFARAKTKNEIHEDILNIKTHIEDTDIYELNKTYNIQFDLYRIPFNQGKGGRPEPLYGASKNGMSNYFARYSPDGKWIVFTQSKTGIMLQPDSQLFIIPASGGIARKMRCNRSLFNSWHSWSWNSRWLLFSSKANTPYTEIFITRVDENGNDSPPVLLSRFSESGYAANVPEFVPIQPDALKMIEIKDH
ncbi:MAG: PD40 domain-containing protein [Desulfobacterales bacterium]|nr:MAG: PD40 domain-containing protein [Desulfobacterales bacterium]